MDSINRLSGMRFIITRPEDRGQALCDRIEAAGGQAVLAPMVDISAVSHQAEFSNTSIVIFTSVYAVELASIDWEELKQSVKQRAIKIFAIGPSTQAMLVNEGIEAKLPKDFTSEGMIELLKSTFGDALQNLSITVVKGAVGRDLLAKWCHKQQISYAEKIIYQRHPVKQFPLTMQAWLAEFPKYPLVSICTSVEAVHLWWQASRLFLKNDDQFPALVVCSQRMVIAAQALAMPIYTVADSCHNSAIYSAISSLNLLTKD